MKGLVIHDFKLIQSLSLKPRDMIFDLLFFIAAPFIFGDSTYFVINSLLMLSISILPLTIKPKFLEYKTLQRMVTLPVSIKQMVMSRYIATLLISLFTIMSVALANIFTVLIFNQPAILYFYSFLIGTLLGMLGSALASIIILIGNKAVSTISIIITFLLAVIAYFVDFPIIQWLNSFFILPNLAQIILIVALYLLIFYIIYLLSVRILAYKVHKL